jgi:hypothetical protein
MMPPVFIGNIEMVSAAPPPPAATGQQFLAIAEKPFSACHRNRVIGRDDDLPRGSENAKSGSGHAIRPLNDSTTIANAALAYSRARLIVRIIKMSYRGA